MGGKRVTGELRFDRRDKCGRVIAMKIQTSTSIRLGIVSLAILMLLLINRPAFAQVTAGLAEISGTVHDATGATVADAAIVISNP